MNFKDFIANADYDDLLKYRRLVQERIDVIEAEPTIKLWYFGDINYIVAYFTSYEECCVAFAEYVISSKDDKYKEEKAMRYKVVYQSEVNEHLETNDPKYRKKQLDNN